MSNEIKIKFILNAEEASIVMASLSQALHMLDLSMQQALEEGLLPIVRMTKEHSDIIKKMMHDVTAQQSYSSKSFVFDDEEMQRKAEEGMQAIKILTKTLNKDKSVIQDTPEEGKKWDKAGDNVVNLLNRFKKEDNTDGKD